MVQKIESQYKEILNQYMQRQSEQNLYVGQNFSRQLISENTSPEEVISMHKAAMQELYSDMPEEVWHSFDFLIEMMINYGLALQERQSLLKRQEELKVEMDLAAHVQETLLKTKLPALEGLDIGLLSVPARKMNGDYIYFISDQAGHAGVAVADVIGKGLPAALCMSMVKFGMDSLNDSTALPKQVLETINRIVEKSIDDSMFVSMFYGRYKASDATLTYGSAGHEPAILYRAKTREFFELPAKGLLLGVSPLATYEEHTISLEKNDLVVMMTDGVTECRTDEGFIERDVIFDLIESKKDEPAQVIVQHVYDELDRMQNAELRDDFTLVIYKKI
ncbi:MULTISPECIES: PP2C family protein-serine/threonine phosphatase [unclassified Planomicrobium]|uniref:PP2C family protein-serine/threonine phosphatase n=1 Tax=unclassified Planomicrobium TaxID=2625360 RepID=UPI0011B4B411|nr:MULTISPECIES: PP2C family protein-serine/threonine phosphatase [unclassified Planomicrobium]TWT02200.1 PP2C family protein-serine/threonine phosphatase [Planomicrobium sp. CPCC 101079]TWT24606.1 PP2C family protein-serine/threonine phosphatase [Planomicrobium sp. CPCC 101110]